MPWEVRSMVASRAEFVALASQKGANVSQLCTRFGISRKSGYKWLGRAAAAASRGAEADHGMAGSDLPAHPLADQSRRPRTSPGQTDPIVEAAVVTLRARHPTWGGRKLHHALRQAGVAAPAPSTITAILDRHELLAPPADRIRPWRRFVHDAPNDLWQMDFMGHRPLVGTSGDPTGRRVHPLMVLDDCSRFALVLAACPHERGELVRTHLTACFARYGLPRAILTDNGPPWGATGQGGVTSLEAWLLRLGVAVWHGRVYHPQTQGKVERLHGTIAADVFAHAPSPTWPPPRRPSPPCAPTTPSCAPTRRSASPCPRSAIPPARAPCPRRRRRSSTPPATRSARSAAKGRSASATAPFSSAGG